MFKAPVNNWDKIISDLLRPLGIPSHPFLMMKLGPLLIRSAISTAKARFQGHRARALFAGNSAHSIMPLDRLSTAAFGIMLGMLGHGVGWPIVKGGSKNFATALESILKTHGGEIRTRAHVESIEDIPPSKAIFLDLAPRNIAEIEGLEFPNHYRDQLLSHKHGPGVFKIDWALDDPIPWKDPDCLRAGTLHIGGTLEEIAESEAAAWTEKPSGKPFVLLSQPSLFDKTRAPEGKHTAWAYCHVPNGCRLDMTGRIENQIQRFAPKFTDRIIERHIMFPSDMRAHNPNYIGGDIAGGAQGLKELFIKPLGSWTPYVTPLKNVYICSSSMPPGAGAHGLCGRLAAKTHLKGE
jgi:phytoene dehydrogenase-like protein